MVASKRMLIKGGMWNVEWRLGSGKREHEEWRMENREWRIENGDWRIKNGRWTMKNYE